MKKLVNIKVNGTAYQREVEPRLLLVHFLRDVLGLTGTQGITHTHHAGAPRALFAAGAAAAVLLALGINAGWCRSR